MLQLLPLAHQPGTVWEYSFGLDVLGFVVEKITQKPLGEALQAFDREGIASLRGKLHDHGGTPLIVTYHPAYLLRNLPDKAKAWDEFFASGALPDNNGDCDNPVVATNALELGIDMGAVDLVVQVESPGSVASGLQRIGRAGHQVGAVSRGIVFPKYRGDLVTAAVVIAGCSDSGGFHARAAGVSPPRGIAPKPVQFIVI